MVVSVAVSSPATRNVAEWTRADWPLAARWPRRAASVTPPAQSPTVFTASLRDISAATWMASLAAAT